MMHHLVIGAWGAGDRTPAHIVDLIGRLDAQPSPVSDEVGASLLIQAEKLRRVEENAQTLQSENDFLKAERVRMQGSLQLQTAENASCQMRIKQAHARIERLEVALRYDFAHHVNGKWYANYSRDEDITRVVEPLLDPTPRDDV